jgi:predicted RND superfamily exporter protein
MKLRTRFTHPGEGGRWLRLSVLVRAMNSSEFYSLLDFINAQARRELAPLGPRGFLTTGIVPLLNDAQKALVRTQIDTFLLAGLVIMAVIGLLFRSWRVMLVVVPPNLTPIMGTFALMGLAGIPLDAATVMIASIAIGIAVDNAIHFLSRYRHTIRQTDSPPEAAGAAYAKMGRAAVFTSVAAAAGFAVLTLARFRPLAEFGILAGFTMLTSLAGDLFLLPPSAALLRVWKKKK